MSHHDDPERRHELQQVLAEQGDRLEMTGDGIGLTVASRRAENERAPGADAWCAGEETFRALVETSNEWMWSMDLDGRLTYSNPAIERMLGYSVEELIGRSAVHLMHEADRERVVSRWPVWIAQRCGWSNLVLRWRQKGGGVRYLESNGVPIQDQAGRVIGFCGSDRDVTDRIRAEAQLRQSEERFRRLNAELEDRVKQRTQALAAANDDLESFSFSVSHDLRAPLRAIDGFSKILLQDYDDRLDEPGKGWLRRIRAAATRMGRLIDDLLMLGRVARSEMQRQRVNLSALAREIVEDLRRTEPERVADVTIAHDLMVSGDRRLLRIVLENLLSNAWKFTAKRDHATIEFGRFAGEGDAVYVVRDNGAGFDMAYAHKLFGPFTRLHGEKEFPGTGVGLATVKRIIDRHGGRVWAEGAMDQGASVYFTLPGEGDHPARSGSGG